MKTITEGQLESVIENIMSDKEKQAEVTGIPFIGVSQDEVISEILKRIGSDWVVNKDEPFRLSREDAATIANSRFYRKSGIKLIMGLAIYVLTIAILTMTAKFINPYIYYILCGVGAVGFVYLYSKKQKDYRAELKKRYPFVFNRMNED